MPEVNGDSARTPATPVESGVSAVPQSSRWPLSRPWLAITQSRLQCIDSLAFTVVTVNDYEL